MHVITYGELLLRLKSLQSERLFQSSSLEATFCGAEANVAVSLANYGVSVSFVGPIPCGTVGNAAVREMRRWGVGMERAPRIPGRLGLFFLESGSNQRPGQVIYDRANSVISELDTGGMDWESALDGGTWFHISGITPALSERAWRLSLEGISYAHKKGLFVSCDLNYRGALWNYGRSAAEVMPEFVRHSDILIANEEDIQMALGLTSDFSVSDALDLTQYQKLLVRVQRQYPNLSAIAITLRESKSASWNDWSGCLYAKGSFLVSQKYQIRNIVDRVGAGDAFAGGLIYGWEHYTNPRDALEFAVAAGCLKHSISGDFNRVSVEEVERLMAGNGLGRVVR